MNGIKFYIKKYYLKIKRIISWIPLLWNTEPYDYSFLIDIMRKQLSDMADFFESDDTWTIEADNKAKEMRIAIKLLDKVYEEEYGTEYFDNFEKKYGEAIPIFDNDNTYKKLYDKFGITERELKEEVSDEFWKSQKKQQKAHRILWKYIEHHIQGWWD